LDLITFSV